MCEACAGKAVSTRADEGDPFWYDGGRAWVSAGLWTLTHEAFRRRAAVLQGWCSAGCCKGQRQCVGHSGGARRHDRRPRHLPVNALAGAGLRVHHGGAACWLHGQYASCPTTSTCSGCTRKRRYRPICNDGTYSYAAHHQSACSNQSGVKVFYK